MSTVARPLYAFAQRIVVAAGDPGASRDAARVFAARGIDVDTASPDDAAAHVDRGVLALAPTESITPDDARALAPIIEGAVAGGGAVVVLAREPRGRGARAEQAAAALAHLRGAGAVITGDPDVWIETAVLLACHGMPAGPRVAVVAPDGSLLLAAANALELEAFGARLPPCARDADDLGPTDIALVDPAIAAGDPEAVGRVMIVPVVARGELLGAPGVTPLCGLRAAIAAARLAGQLAERQDDRGGDDDAIVGDRVRFDRQLSKLGDRAGDHEAKVLLASWDVPITRQAVATTASAAARLAKRAGYPVEIKPWGPDIPSERDGCPVERDLTSAADVRRAYAAVAREAELESGAPVIVRAAPGRGRELSLRIARVSDLGWMVMADLPGAHGPSAAPAPLSRADAGLLASSIEATRAGDPEPDREALIDLLMRASRCATDNADHLEELELGRVIVFEKGRGALVADARAILRTRR